MHKWCIRFPGGDMKLSLRIFLAMSALLLFGASAMADSYFIGTWKYGNCVLHLKGANALGEYAAETNFCSNEWAFVTTWRPTGDGVEVLTILKQSVARLSLQRDELVVRLNTGQRIAFQRTTPPPAGGRPPVAARGGTVPVYKPHPFVANQRCVKRGRSDRCASDYDLGLPRDLPRNSTAYTKSVDVTVFPPLNFRARIGFDQPIHFVIPAGTCIPIWACFETKDTGPWCVTRLNGKQGYVAKYSRRDDGSMQVNFGNGCGSG